MRKLLFALAAVSVLIALPAFSSQPARADEVAGTILALDPEGNTFSLDDGWQYVLPDDISQDDLEVGMELLVTFEPSDDGIRVATALELIN
ncbi:DUF1344 domain-containing protein [Rhodobacterales bacterium]|nr:DUF1344 domain-containing protein [Rhodobacterales bacterium]